MFYDRNMPNLARAFRTIRMKIYLIYGARENFCHRRRRHNEVRVALEAERKGGRVVAEKNFFEGRGRETFPDRERALLREGIEGVGEL